MLDEGGCSSLEFGDLLLWYSFDCNVEDERGTR